jgi:acylphosphatase
VVSGPASHAPDSLGRMADVRLTVRVRGRVQGVGFRWWTRAVALDLGVAGWATNLPDGSVEIVAEGSEERCRTLLDLLDGPPKQGRPGYVAGVTTRWSVAHGNQEGFVAR